MLSHIYFYHYKPKISFYIIALEYTNQEGSNYFPLIKK